MMRVRVRVSCCMGSRVSFCMGRREAGGRGFQGMREKM